MSNRRVKTTIADAMDALDIFAALECLAANEAATGGGGKRDEPLV